MLDSPDYPVVAPTPTPFRADDSIDFDALQRNVDRWLATPLSGFVVNSENGEEAFLSEAEKLQIVRSLKQVCGDERLLIAGIDSPSITEALRLAEAFVAAGAHRIRLRIPRLIDNVDDYLQQVIPRCPVPVLVINQPAPGMFLNTAAAGNATAEMIGDVAAMDNVDGYIASANIRFEARVRTFVPAEKHFWTGNGSLLLAGAVIGADGACLMLGNIAPRECVDVLRLASEGLLAEAKSIQDRLHEPDWQILSRRAAGLKAALNLLGFEAGVPGESDRSWQRGLGGFDAGDDPNNLRATALRWWNGIRCAVRSVLSNWFKDGSLRPWSRLRRRYFLAGSHAVSTNSRRSVCEHERRVRLSWSRQWSELHFGFDRWLSIRQIHRPWRFLPISRSLM